MTAYEADCTGIEHISCATITSTLKHACDQSTMTKATRGCRDAGGQPYPHEGQHPLDHLGTYCTERKSNATRSCNGVDIEVESCS